MIFHPKKENDLLANVYKTWSLGCSHWDRWLYNP